ncbi:MAG: ATP-binding protein [Acidobacteriota bacterium]|nr:ATP-binding protein [Acidobacteriota bacterium]
MPVEHVLRPQPQLVHRAMLDALVDLSADPLWVVDAAGIVITSNSAFHRWWNDVTGTMPAIGAALEGGAPQLAELQRRALGGRSIMANVRVIVAGIERTYTLTARPVETGGVAFTAREVPAETEGVERGVELALLHLFASNDPLDELLTKTLEFLCATDHWDAATLWTIDGDVLRPRAMWFESPSAREKLAPRFATLALKRGEGPPGRVWESGDVVWVADMFDETLRERANLAAAAGLHSVVATPLVDEQRITGVLELFTHTIRPINEPTRRMLTRTGAALARLIERRSLIEQIARKGAEWLLTVDSIRMPILLVGTDGRIARVNRTAHELAGLEYEELLGRPLLSLGEGEPWKTLFDVVTAVHDSAMTCTAEIAVGERRWDVSASPITAAGEDDRVVIIMRDTTELVRLQESVRRGEQLAALGELVAGVAHEVKNPLFGMSVTLDLLDQQLADVDEKTRAEAGEMTAALRTWIARLQSLTENLLAYGRTWTIELEPGDLHRVVSQAIFASQPLARDAGVDIDADLDDASHDILMDATRLALVFENLLVNAVQHSRRGDRIRVEAHRDGDSIAVAVRDQGPGFNPDELSRIFQPFFTRRRGGTGLGLSIVQRIVDEHGGTVAASNGDQGGAVVLVRLPTYHPTR